jgi:hypothetical protein
VKISKLLEYFKKIDAEYTNVSERFEISGAGHGIVYVELMEDPCEEDIKRISELTEEEIFFDEEEESFAFFV